jgi:spore maturation protein CgeB
MSLNIVIFGLSISSSWGNGHATTYRALVKALEERGHHITFLERDVPWYAEHRDAPAPSFCDLRLYGSLKEVPRRFGKLVASADLVIVGSYVPDGAALGEWATGHARGVTAFYDIDTPVTLAKLSKGEADYIVPALIPRFDIYLSFTGGPALRFIEETYGSPRAVALYCAVDPGIHAPRDIAADAALGYLGTYSADRQPALARMLIEPAKAMPKEHFLVAGAQYPQDIAWPANVTHFEHLPPAGHPEFYCRQRYTLNVTRADTIAAGYSPSVRLFEAAACGVPIISDSWPGLETLFTPGAEILTASTTAEVLQILRNLPEERRRDIAAAAHKAVLRNHTADHRANQLENNYREALASRGAPRAVTAMT